MCSTWFPRRSLPADVSLPSTGFSGAGSPASPVLSKKLRLRAAHPAALRCLRLAVPQRSLVVSLPGGRVRRRSLELVTRSLPPVLHRGNDTISQVPEEPQLSVCTCSVDSGRIDDTRPLRCRDVAPGDRTAKAPTLGLSKLNSMAFGLAAYASQAGLPRHHARLASGCWSGATGRAFHPQDSDEKFPSCE